ncbi:MAG: hypothetical protein KBT03_04795 [Bacteroidales bacterium]|nr:hypothetical protein [Candidatus Scybalousia scybalohippi]
MKQGYIKIYRKIKDSFIWADKEPYDKRSAWLDLLMKANYKDKKVFIENKLVLIPRGSFHTSIKKLSEEWKWNEKKTSKFLKALESDKMLTVIRSAHGSTITIENYGVYQDMGSTDGSTDSAQMGAHFPTTNKYKEIDKDNIKQFSKNKQFNSMEQQDYDFDLLEKKGTK